MNPAKTRVFWVEPVNPRPGLAAGTMLRVELHQTVGDRGRGPHVVGEAEVLADGVLKLSLTTITDPGRSAAGLIADGVLDVVLHGSRPIVRLTQVPQ